MSNATFVPLFRKGKTGITLVNVRSQPAAFATREVIIILFSPPFAVCVVFTKTPVCFEPRPPGLFVHAAGVMKTSTREQITLRHSVAYSVAQIHLMNEDAYSPPSSVITNDTPGTVI